MPACEAFPFDSVKAGNQRPSLVSEAFLKRTRCFSAHFALAASALQFASLLTVGAEPPPPTTPADAREYVYKTVNGTAVALDVFSPQVLDVAKPRPVLIYFHGGGWTSGDKGYTYQFSRYFARRGLVVATVNYRFMTQGATGIEGTKAFCLLDAKSAIRWVRSHAKELGVDPNRVILGGSSADRTS